MTPLMRTDVTPRHGQVLALMAEGLSADEIGERLFIAGRSVDDLKLACYRRLGIEATKPDYRAVALWAAGTLTITGQDDA